MKKNNDLITFLVICCVFAAAWTGFNIYHSYATSKIPETLKTQVSPITPSFDVETLQKVKSRTVVEPNYQLPTAIISPSSTPSAQSAASPSAEVITPQPTISSGPQAPPELAN